MTTLIRCHKCRRYRFGACACEPFRVWVPEHGEDEAADGRTVWAQDAEEAAERHAECAHRADPSDAFSEPTEYVVRTMDGAVERFKVYGELTITWHTKRVRRGLEVPQ